VLVLLRAFERLDLLISLARKYDVKLIIPFINFENEFMSMQYFVYVAHGKGWSMELFYASSKVR
jgi:hypothetical protein